MITRTVSAWVCKASAVTKLPSIGAILLEQTGQLDAAVGMIEAALKIAPQEVALLEMLRKLKAARGGTAPVP
jgi:hypothetical protein